MHFSVHMSYNAIEGNIAMSKNSQFTKQQKMSVPLKQQHQTQTSIHFTIILIRKLLRQW